ncbi:MAG: hypothetical protein WAW17_17645 [Rhodococcus sp. (in: high G+C Gram-positive bacteria)]|uniref:hypothetical protein n=1 Tax=Rhodococcus sp. TaxID=1831 RepID=UPI003BB0488C
MESFAGLAHEEMYAKTQEMDPSVIGELAQACHAIAASLPIGFGFALLRSTIAESWRGTAADAALAATKRLAGASDQLTSGVQAIGVKLDILSSAASDVKASIPQPAAPLSVSQLPLSPLATESSETAREAARLEAVRKLEAIYVPNYRDVGTNVPQLPAPYVPSGSGGGPDSSPFSSVTGSGTPTGAGGDSTAATDTESVDGQSGDDDSAATTTAGAEGAAGQSTSGSAGSPTQTSAASAQNESGLGSSNGTGSAAFGGSGTGSGGSGFGGAGSPTRRRNDNDKKNSDATNPVVPGSPVPPGGAAAGAGAAAVATAATPVRPSMSRPGMGMGPTMMGAPGRGAGGTDNDTEHQTPSYLINIDNGNGLIGTLDPVAPPVIGA